MRPLGTNFDLTKKNHYDSIRTVIDLWRGGKESKPESRGEQGCSAKRQSALFFIRFNTIWQGFFNLERWEMNCKKVCGSGDKENFASTVP